MKLENLPYKINTRILLNWIVHVWYQIKELFITTDCCKLIFSRHFNLCQQCNSCLILTDLSALTTNNMTNKSVTFQVTLAVNSLLVSHMNLNTQWQTKLVIMTISACDPNAAQFSKSSTLLAVKTLQIWSYFKLKENSSQRLANIHSHLYSSFILVQILKNLHKTPYCL